MKKIIYLALIIALLSCDQSQNSGSKSETIKESKFRNLLLKFKEKAFDTLKVYSPDKLTGEYKGVELDSADVVLFPRDIAQQHFNDPPGLFAVYKFSIDSNRIALIARTPSEYVPSSIKLFLFDKRSDSITSYIELAESWGDAGDYMSKDAWIYKDKGNGTKSFIWLLEGHDNSVDNEKDSTVQEWNYYFLVDLSKDRIDTLSKDVNELKRKFSHLIHPPTSR